MGWSRRRWERVQSNVRARLILKTAPIECAAPARLGMWRCGADRVTRPPHPAASWRGGPNSLVDMRTSSRRRGEAFGEQRVQDGAREVKKLFAHTSHCLSTCKMWSRPRILLDRRQCRGRPNTCRIRLCVPFTQVLPVEIKGRAPTPSAASARWGRLTRTSSLVDIHTGVTACRRPWER